jgi:hypothetical protein
MGIDQEQQPLYPQQMPVYHEQQPMSIVMPPPTNYTQAVLSFNLPQEVEIWALRTQDDHVLQAYVYNLPPQVARERLINYHSMSNKSELVHVNVPGIVQKLGLPTEGTTTATPCSMKIWFGVHSIATLVFIILSIVSSTSWRLENKIVHPIGIFAALAVALLEGNAYRRENIKHMLGLRASITAGIAVTYLSK